MKHTIGVLTVGLALAAQAASAQTTTFSSGSNGSYGAINVTANTTLDVPPDGVFHCTTINIDANRTLTFRRNAANTPVYLLAQGNVTISGAINVNGSQGNGVIGGIGGPGGFDGGSPASVSVPAGAGYGPGAGKPGAGNTVADGAGSGAFSTVGSQGTSANKGAVYGNALCVPLIGGSGGGGTLGTPGGGGGGGGGAVLVASTTRIQLNGDISAEGSTSTGNSFNGGSGGAIRLVAPVVAGTGRLFARGGGGGGLGRIRIDAIDRTQLGFTFFNQESTSVGSLMMVFPTPVPRLDIVEAAGTAVPEGSGPVTLQLPFGSTPNRTIRVQARDFNSEVPITVVLTPDHGTPTSYAARINNVGANPATVTVDVVLPVNEQTTVHVFSK